MEEYLNELKNKFGYNDEVLKAIEITISLMVKEYGEAKRNEIYSLFRDTEIFALKSVDNRSINTILESKKNYNQHIRFDESKGEKSNFHGGAYSFDPIYDDNMHVVGESRFIIVEDMRETDKEDGYRRLFGTSINIPNFIHEANHAYAMMEPYYSYEDNKVVSKHGFVNSVSTYTKDDDGKYLVSDGEDNDVVLEEMVNESVTRKMLVDLFKVNDYNQVYEKLKEIGHVSNAYNDLLVSLAIKLENLLGLEELLNVRRNNDLAAIERFNVLAKRSQIALEYFGDTVPFDYFRKKVNELYTLGLNKYKIDEEQYAYESAVLVVEAFSPLMAYQDVAFATMDLESFNKLKDNYLSAYPQYKSGLNQ